MTKELEALERIKREAGIPYFSSLYDIDMWREDFSIIEKTLIDYEMEHTLRIRLENTNYELVREKQDNEKKLKAFEIIKENVGLKMSVDEDICCLYIPIVKTFEPLEQNIVVVGCVKGKDKIDLLKEILL